MHANEDIGALVTGEVDAQTVASRHGLTVAQVEVYRQLFIAGMRSANAGSRALKRRGWLLRAGAAAAVLLTVLVSRQALSAACTGQPNLPSGLVVFCPSTPALAIDINSNFLALANWLIAKTGPLGDSNIITTGNVSTSAGSFTTNSGSFSTLSGSVTTSTGNFSTASGSVSAALVNTKRLVNTGLETAAAYAPAFADWNTYASSLTGNAGIINDNANYKALMIAGNTVAGGQRIINMYDRVNVNGGIYSSGRAAVVDVRACATGSSGGACCPSGYDQDGQDMNQGAGGAFVYLCRLRAY